MKPNFALALALALCACSGQKFKIAVNGGPAGADVARMAASEIRQSRAAKGRWVDVRIPAMAPVVRGTVTPQLMGKALDSLPDDQKTAIVITRFLDQESIEAAQGFRKANLPFIATTPPPPGLVSADGPGFSMVPNYLKEAQYLAQLAEKADRIAIIHIDNAYGNGLTQALIDSLHARGMEPVDVRKYEQSWDEPRMVALGRELSEKKDPTLVYFIGRAPSLELVWQPFREVGKTLRVIGSDLVESTAVYENPEGRFTGLRYVRFFDPQAPETRMKDLHDRYAMWISRGEMTGEPVLIYDAMMMTREALKSGARTRAELRQYFASLGRSRPAFNGVGGPVSFTDNGEVQRKFELAEVTNKGVIPAESRSNNVEAITSKR